MSLLVGSFLSVRGDVQVKGQPPWFRGSVPVREPEGCVRAHCTRCEHLVSVLTNYSPQLWAPHGTRDQTPWVILEGESFEGWWGVENQLMWRAGEETGGLLNLRKKRFWARGGGRLLLEGLTDGSSATSTPYIQQFMGGWTRALPPCFVPVPPSCLSGLPSVLASLTLPWPCRHPVP